jgi:hypothetical protein
MLAGYIEAFLVDTCRDSLEPTKKESRFKYMNIAAPDLHKLLMKFKYMNIPTGFLSDGEPNSLLLSAYMIY